MGASSLLKAVLVFPRMNDIFEGCFLQLRVCTLSSSENDFILETTVFNETKSELEIHLLLFHGIASKTAVKF